MPAPKHALIEHHTLGAYRVSFSRELGRSPFSIHDPTDERLVGGGVVDGQPVLRFEDPARDQSAVTPLCPRILELWKEMQAALIADGPRPPLEPSPYKWFWLSFVKDGGFAGASIVGPCDHPIQAPPLAHRLSCNPGGEVVMFGVTDEHIARVPTEYRCRLLSMAEVQMLESLLAGASS